MYTFYIITVMVIKRLIGQFLSDYVGILIPEKEYGTLDHILVPKIKV